MNDSSIRVTLRLHGLPEDAAFDLVFPPGSAGLSIIDLLERIFPAEDDEQQVVRESFDLALNPDLPEIYEQFLPVMDQFLFGLCELQASDSDGLELHLEDPVARHLLPQSCIDGRPGRSLSLSLRPVYHALEYAQTQEFTAGEPDLELWLRICLAMYFLDKHEVVLPALTGLPVDDPLRRVVGELFQRELVEEATHGDPVRITPAGRQFIGELLAETEDYIDDYDVYKDVIWEEDEGGAIFDSGHGHDLRVEAFLADNLDPVRVVFLLRLYDGTLDEFSDNWRDFVTGEAWLNWVLEPVVNRSLVAPEALELIIEDGTAYLDKLEGATREQRRQTRLARRINLPGE